MISTPVDFIGINYYRSYSIQWDKSQWPHEFTSVSTGRDTTQKGWEIWPEGLYDLLLWLHQRYQGVKILITENGAATNDIVNREGKVEDENRLDYLYLHMEQMHKAIEAGVNLKGYYAWSMMDNFEWSQGYDQRFGIVYIDYKTQKRTIKKSGYWYRDVIRNNGF